VGTLAVRWLTSVRWMGRWMLREGMDLGTGGHISWSRDSVHER
jgi:hypothetical protein